MESWCCPKCNDSRVIPGHMRYGLEGGTTVGYVPYGVSPFPVILTIPLSSGFLCCFSCGHIWASLDPEKLRTHMRINGDELARQYLDFLEAGPYRDLPDVAEAHVAGDKVAEIDVLVLAGRRPEATRRFRDLSQVTWDQAIAALRNWRYLPRPQKLAMFGWTLKETSTSDPSMSLDHPMRDRWLDG
jgi:hypothetical protein